MSLRVHYEILNQKGTPAFFSDTYANRPAFGYQGRVFISTDTGQIFEDTGSAWTLIADAGVGGGTLASVTANGNTTATGIVITAGGLSTDSLTDTALTTGSVLFSGTGGLVSQKNANLFWDNTNNRLGIGTTSPGAPLDIHSTGTNAQFNGTGTSNAYLQFQNAGVSKWRIGNTYNAGANTLDIYNNGLATNALSIKSTTNESIFSGSVGIGSGTNPAFILDVAGNTRVTGQLSAYASGSGYGLYVQGLSNQYAARILGDATASNSYGLTIQAGTNGTDSPFTITNYAANATFLKVNGTGNVLIASTTSAGSVLKLQIGDGTADTRSYFNPSSQYALALANSSSNAYYLGVLTSGTTSSFALHNAAVGVNPLIITYGGVITISNLAGTGSRAVLADASGNLSAPVSDISVKENIQTIGYGLNEIIKMKPVWFDFIDEYKNYGSGRQNGNIALEMELIIPEAVFTTSSTGKKGINYDQLHAVYIKAIQELNEKLERNNIN